MEALSIATGLIGGNSCQIASLVTKTRLGADTSKQLFRPALQAHPLILSASAAATAPQLLWRWALAK